MLVKKPLENSGGFLFIIKSMKSILVYCSANDLQEKYTKPAIEFGKLIAENNYSLVWGGSNTGLMKVMADTVQEDGGKIVGVSVEFLKWKARENADEMIIAKDLSERKAMMLERGDAIIVLPGGIGTLDEVTETIEHKKHKHHTKSIVFLNSDNFYEGLKIQFQKMYDDGFLTHTIEEIVFFADTPREAIDYINKELA